MSAKEQQRNLKKEVGRQAAEAVAEVQRVASQLALEHRVLARQMQDFETTVATLKASRTADHRHYDDLLAPMMRRLDALDPLRAQHDELYMAQGAFEHYAIARVRRFESMTFWQRLRWNVTGRLPRLLPDTIAADGAYPGDGV